VEHQNAVTGGLSHAFEQLVENSEIHERTSESLMRTADSVRQAAEAIDETATDFRPLLEGLKQTGSALSETASRIQATQESSAQTAEAVATSVELSRHALDSQHRLLETSLDEIRSTLGLLSRGLGENLSRALRGVDSALDLTVGRLRKTILESNETIDRMTIPIRATETTVLEMRAALDQVRADIVSLNDWLIRIAEPVRDTLAQLDDKATFLTRALQEFGDRARSVEHDMDELRGELRATGRSHPGADRARAGAALELEEPSRETEYAAGAEAESAEQEEAEAEEVAGHEEDTELATPGPEPETEIAAAASDAGAASGESRAEDELAQAPAHQQDAKADRANGVPDYRTQAPELFAIMAERSPAATAAISDDYRDTANAGEAECDAEAAEAVSLSGLLSRPRLAEPDQPVATAAEKQDGTPADSAAAGDEDQPHADSRRTFRRLFGSKS
jgi:ABC-type transporter Mla subunit MlaD